MPGLRLLPLGIGDAFSALSYSTCMALEADGCWLLIDCPHPIRKMMREASATAAVDLDAAVVHAVVLTHLHADHVSGVEGLAFYNRFLLDRKLRLVAHASVSEHLWSGHLAVSMQRAKQEPGQPDIEHRFEDFFDLQEVSVERTVSVGPFTISIHPATHSLPVTAVFVEAAGRKFGCSADTTYDPRLIDWLSRADLIVHDAGGGFPHTPYQRLADLPIDVRKKMLLAHCPDGFEPPGREIGLLRQGMNYWV
ncbi:MAG: MBL fold metallo-hydrolase [Thermoguttaceae bacterium]